ncbi:50S ribosomal protein L20 [Patescibacteria group bacterium]
MTRVKRGVTTKRRHKKVLKRAKGFRGGRKNLFKRAKEATIRAGQHAYAHRRTKKRDFRRLWIVRLNAALRMRGLKYSEFVNLMKKNKIELDRKILSDLAVKEPEVFDKIVEEVKK